MAYRIANVGKTGILKVKKSNAEQLKYRPDLGDVELDLSSELNTNTTGQFNTITGGLLESCVVNLEPIQSGSGEPSPSNVRPITGHSSVEVDVCGINIFSPLSYETVDLTGSGAYRYGHIYSTGTYTIINKSAQQISYRLPKADLSDRGTTVNIDANGSATITVDATHVLWVFMFTWSSSVAEKICVRKDNDTTFVEFNGTDYTIPLGQTVYGGSLDVVSGVLTVDKGYVEFNGASSESWALITGTNFHQYYIPSIIEAKDSVNAISNRFPKISLTERGTKTGFVSYDADNAFRFALKDDELLISDVNAWKTWLSSNPLQVAYELATPIVIQLTPQQINTLIGENHLDVPLEGQSLDSAVYRELFAWDDVEKAIEPKSDISAIGTDESGRTTASRSYAQGEHFYKDGKFGTTTTGVAQGATWTLNTNYVEGTIADNIRFEDALVTPTTGMTYTNRDATRFGQVVNIYLYMGAPSGTATNDVIIGTTPFKPFNNFAFLNIYSQNQPYEIVGSAFIRKNTGEIIIAKGSSIPSGQNIFVAGTYICQRQ